MHLSSFIALSALAVNPASALPLPSTVVVEHCDFGERYQFERFDCSLTLKNSGEKSLRISRVTAANASDDVMPTEALLEPGKSIELKMRVAPEAASGTISRMVSFETDEAGSPNQRVYAYGFVNSILKDPVPLIDFEKVRVKGDLPARKVSLESIESDSFRITGILESPNYVDASIGPDGRTVYARIKSSVPWGAHEDDRIVVSLNSKVQKSTAIALRVQAVGDIAPLEDPALLGIVRTDESRDYFIDLENSSGREFKHGKIAIEGVAGSADLVDCSPAAKGCKRLRLHMGKNLPMAPIKGLVTVELPDFKQTLPIRFEGMALPLGMDPVPEEKSSDVKPTPGAPPPKSKPADVGSEIRAQVRDSNAPVPPGSGPLLKWSVADEAAVYGYYILRAEQQSGPFEKLNAETIKAEKFEPGLVNSYQWRDTSAEIGKVYWYSVGTLYRDGRKEPLTSPQKVVAKR